MWDWADGGPGGRTCTPGCFPPGERCEDLHRDWFCSWGADHLQTALSSPSFTWNELVVDTATVEAHLPQSILAFFHVPGGDVGAAVGYRDGFAGMYGLGADVAPPVVQLDLAQDAPFSLVG